MGEAEGRDQNKQKECHLVTGGGGYPGFRLGLALHKKGHAVILFDIREPSEAMPDGMKFIKVRT